MIHPGLKDKVVLITEGNNPFGICAAIARAFSSQGAHVFVHYFSQSKELSEEDINNHAKQQPGLALFFRQQAKKADEVLASIRDAGGKSGYIPSDTEETLIKDIPLKRIGRPEDIANAVIFFASEQAAWITGLLLIVHGGHRMALGLQ